MWGWESCEIVLASRSNRCRALADAEKMGRQHLDRDGPLQPRVPRLVHLPHSARAQGRENLVGAEASAGCKRHRT